MIKTRTGIQEKTGHKGQNMKPTISRGLPSIPVTESKRAEWKHHCHIAIKQKDGACLATAIIHASAIFKGDTISKCFYEHDADNLDKKGYRYSMEKTLGVAMRLGYIRACRKINSFDGYKANIKDHPILIGFDQFEGTVTPSCNGAIGPTGKRTGTRHVMLSLGRNPMWLFGHYSVLKNSRGPDWGECFGEVDITDGDLKELWDKGSVEAWAIVK